jgi:hypothetical protein
MGPHIADKIHPAAPQVIIHLVREDIHTVVFNLDVPRQVPCLFISVTPVLKTVRILYPQLVAWLLPGNRVMGKEYYGRYAEMS